MAEIRPAITGLDPSQLTLRPWLSTDALRGRKFSGCLPEPLALEVLERRLGARQDAGITTREKHLEVASSG